MAESEYGGTVGFDMALQGGVLLDKYWRVGARVPVAIVKNDDAPYLPSGTNDDGTSTSNRADDDFYIRWGLGALLGVQTEGGVFRFDVAAGVYMPMTRCTAWHYPEGTCSVYQETPATFWVEAIPKLGFGREDSQFRWGFGAAAGYGMGHGVRITVDYWMGWW